MGLGFALIIVLSVVMALVAGVQFSRTSDNARMLVEDRMIKVERANKIIDNLNSQANTARNIAPCTPNIKYRHAVHCFLADPEYGERLAKAMAEVGMIDKVGFGIHDMVQAQRRRFLPLPDYEGSTPLRTVFNVYGQEIDANYTQWLMERTDLSIEHVLWLDRVQKKHKLDAAQVAELRQAGLIEGRNPRLHISAKVAVATGQEVEYLNQRRPDAEDYKTALCKLLALGPQPRTKVDELLLPKLQLWIPDIAQRKEYVKALLSYLPQNNSEEPPQIVSEDTTERMEESLNTLIPDGDNTPYDIRDAITAIFDHDSFLEIQPNYAANAVKFTEGGSVILRVKLLEESPDAALLRFEVEDSGIGIDPEVLSRLFRAFEQADNTMTRKHGGTGLGLAITRELAERMGGAAGASSCPGVGSTFWFTARLGRGQRAGLPAVHFDADADAEATLTESFAGRRVLLADDEPINQIGRASCRERVSSPV